MIIIVDAIQALCPKAQWILRGNELEWLDTEQTQPSDEEIQTEIARLTYLEGINQYQVDRQYPPMNEQLDNIFHNGVDAWKADIQAIKDATPKVLPVQADQDAYVTAHVDTYTFNKQLAAYKTAVIRLDKYVLSVGQAEVTEMQDSLVVAVDADDMPVLDSDGNTTYVQESVIITAFIEALDATVEQTTYSDDEPPVATVSTVTNPLIVTDVAERAAAQTVVDNTPQPVKDTA
jgi:hypothetical protein